MLYQREKTLSPERFVPSPSLFFVSHLLPSYRRNLPGISGWPWTLYKAEVEPWSVCFHLPTAGITGVRYHPTLNIFKLGLKGPSYYYYFLIELDYKVMNLTMAPLFTLLPYPHSKPQVLFLSLSLLFSFPKFCFVITCTDCLLYVRFIFVLQDRSQLSLIPSPMPRLPVSLVSSAPVLNSGLTVTQWTCFGQETKVGTSESHCEVSVSVDLQWDQNKPSVTSRRNGDPQSRGELLQAETAPADSRSHLSPADGSSKATCLAAG